MLKTVSTAELIELGLGTRFGKNWPGKRCQARTRRRGNRCQNPALKGRARCRLHGGKSTGPKSVAGLEKSRMANWKHGQRSAEAIRRRKEGMALRREVKRIADLAKGWDS